MQSRRVKVRAELDGAGKVDFEIDGFKAKDSRIKLHKDSGPHELLFDLHDRTGRDLRFDPQDPIWVDEDCPCPPRQGLNSDQLAVIECADRLLTAENRNSGRPRELRYQLNFIAADGSRETCDPVVQNGGGGGGMR